MALEIKALQTFRTK